MAKLTLDIEQLEAVEKMVNEPTRAALNASQYGVGKTLVTVEVAQRVAPEGIKVIVAPLHTKYGWRSTILGQYPDQEVKFVDNKSKAGRQALEDLQNRVPGWYIFGREYFHTIKVSEILAKKGKYIDFMAYDECQRWSNHKSQSFTRIRRIQPKYRMALSATPAGNKFSGMFAIHQWLWPSLEGHRSFWSWVEDWCTTEEDYFSGTVVTGEKVPGAFVNSLPCYVRLEKDFGSPIHDRVVIQLSAKERKIYEQIERHMIAFLNDNPLIIKFPMTKRMRLRQASLGEIAYDEASDTVYFPMDMKSSKYDALVSLIKDHRDEPMLILTDSAKYANVVAARLALDGFAAVSWTGDVSETERHEIKEAFEKNQGVDYIVATIGAIGEGVDGLQHRAHIMVWLSRSDNMVMNEQAFRRLHRRGQTKTVISIDIVAENTYDEGQLGTLIERALAMNKSLKKKRGK